MALYVIPRRVAWFDTLPGRVDALATMSLMQMIADVYEDAYDSKPDSSSPNEAQKAVRVWLAYARFLPPLPQKELLPSDQFSLKTVASSSTILNSPKTPSKKWPISMGSLKLSRKRTRSGLTDLLSPSRSLLSLSPSKLWRRRRESTSSFTTVSEPTSPSTPPATPSRSSRSLPVTPTYKKRPRFPTKTAYRQDSIFYDVQVSPSPQSRTRTSSLDTLESTFHASNTTRTHRSTRSLSFGGDTTPSPRLARSFSSPSLNSSSSSFKSPPWSTQKPILNKDPSEDRLPGVSLWTLFTITMLGYLFFFFLFLGCCLMVIYRFLGIFWGTIDE